MISLGFNPDNLAISNMVKAPSVPLDKMVAVSLVDTDRSDGISTMIISIQTLPTMAHFVL